MAMGKVAAGFCRREETHGTSVMDLDEDLSLSRSGHRNLLDRCIGLQGRK